ncbi:MAG: outer membrane protein assembly factor BamD [Paludibacteraceae bacterium]|nr:outer membrane protein assembly factor BamD [Paludibacteraceae bacterium]
MEKNFRHITLAIMALGFLSCGGYNKVIKSTDNDFKYQKAVEYYESGDYYKAHSVLESVGSAFRGTAKGENVVYMIAKSYYNNKDYTSAKSYFSAYTRSYPQGEHAEECKFLAGKCLYQDSPDVKLDQASTVTAIDELLEFTNLYPQSQYLPEAVSLLSELQEKLAEKAYLNAKLYFDLGDYMGNNYRSAVVTATNALKLYPDTKRKEDLSFLILDAKYMQAVKSVESKMEDRYRDTDDEYYNYIGEFPNGKHKKEAERIHEKTRKYINAIDNKNK